MHVFVVFKLVRCHVKPAAMNFTQAQVSGTNQKIAFGKAHGSGAVATATALVKHQIPMLFPQLVYNSSGFVGNRYPLYKQCQVAPLQVLKESQWILVIRHQDILGVTIMTQHHFVIFPPDAGLFIAPK